uniref:Uncharacterized protein n=1 Tax=Eutreptiella gymnastica TaxID=73025 RepID=A0A7S1JBJ6_9EUGL
MSLQMEIELDICMAKLQKLKDEGLLSHEEYEARANELSAKMDDMKTYLQNRKSMRDTYPTGTTAPLLSACFLNTAGVDVGYVKVNAYCVLCKTFRAAMFLDEWRCHSCQGQAFLYPPPKADQDRIRQQQLFDQHKEDASTKTASASAKSNDAKSTTPQLKAKDGPKLLGMKREAEEPLTPAAKLQRISEVDIKPTCARFGFYGDLSAEKVKDAGAAAYKEKKYVEAIALWSHAGKLAPKSSITYLIHSNLSQAYLAFGIPNKALAEAERCISAAPAWDKGYIRKTGALQAVKHVTFAIAACKKGLQLGSQATVTTSTGPITVPNVCRSLLEEKLQELSAVAARVDEMKDAGNASVKEEKWKHAISSYNAAINIDASNHLLFSNRSLCYLKLNDVEAAMKDADMCVELAPKWPKGYLRQAEVMKAKGMRIEACQAEDTAESLMEALKNRG